MTITKDELAELLDEVIATIGQILVQHSILREDMLGRDTETAKSKIDSLRLKLDTERIRLRKHMDAEKRKRELEKSNKEHERQATKKRTTSEAKNTAATMTPLLNERGVVIGWIQPAGAGRTNILDRKGRVVARELNGITLDSCGRLRGRGQQGLRLLGQSMAA
ncbi:MAG: hypothetical protein EXS37_08045 [Opitutus sp.]|nr:hypothetical protein [Opitutus sp.]